MLDLKYSEKVVKVIVILILTIMKFMPFQEAAVDVIIFVLIAFSPKIMQLFNRWTGYERNT